MKAVEGEQAQLNKTLDQLESQVGGEAWLRRPDSFILS